jgi:hypothetical protein
MSEDARNKVMNIVNNSFVDSDAKELHQSNNLTNVKKIRLPDSEYVVSVSIQSAYDFIYKSLEELKKNTEERYNNAALLSSIIRGIYVPDDDGEYFEFTSSMDIIKLVYSLSTLDLKVLYKMNEKLFKDSTMEFGLMNVVCPHCRATTNTVPIDVETVLFYKYHQEVNTKLD